VLCRLVRSSHARRRGPLDHRHGERHDLRLVWPKSMASNTHRPPPPPPPPRKRSSEGGAWIAGGGSPHVS
jgi:hypothetical protein